MFIIGGILIGGGAGPPGPPGYAYDPNHQNKLKAFFEASLHDKQKQVSLLESQVKSANKDLVLASLKMAHVVMKRKRPRTELESVVLPCLEIAADILHGGKKLLPK